MRSRTITAGLAAALLALAGCGGAPSTAEDAPTREVDSDHKDAPVKVPKDPKRVVTLGWATGPLLEIEGSPIVGAADSETRDYTPENRKRFEKLPKVGERTEISVEQVAELKPDLILSGIPAAAQMDYGQLEEIAPVVVSAPTAPADWKKTTERVWDAAGVTEDGEQLVTAYDKRAEEVGEAVADSPAADWTFAAASEGKEARLRKGDWMLEFQDSWSTTVLGDAGLEFLPREQGPEVDFQTGLSFEELDRLDEVDAVIMPAGPDGKATPGSRKLMDQGPWKETEPAQADRVYPLVWSQAASYRTGILLFDEFDEQVLGKL
ncbi:iron complex transport system substrate-binding protein [Murinocardiopsis flavida]|uniref:Iron complex transport system substrate-binding protein n=1 Tax=Murinocardiopsis flavida TaxID=645275 RepID=A0A2P8CQY0_9ACTN|nr:ABC transporter substrate-binding protein [Murinocardiopsis flavida]PSK87369.1 iron complex transport system substrate-binding protein [Murinocardiopsis flavida]